MRPVRLTLLTAILAAVATLHAQQTITPPPVSIPAQEAPTPDIATIQVRARAVLLDVVVTDSHGKPVRGLKASDFVIQEDGAPQTVASFEPHEPLSAADRDAAAAAAKATAALGPNTFSNDPRLTVPPSSGSTVILLDMLDTPVVAQQVARQQLLKFLKTKEPGVELAIFELDTQLHLIQGFTSDQAVLIQAVQDREKLGRTAIPLANNPTMGRVRMDALTAAMHDLGAYLQPLPGRKNLIWFTAKIPRTSYDDGTMVGGALRDSMSFDYDFAKTAEFMRLGRIAIYPVDARGLQTDPAFSAANDRAPSVRSAQRFSTQQFIDHTDLEEVAEATGGKAFYNTNGLSQAIEEVVDSGASYYTLSYYPTNKKWDGSYRKIKLQLDQPNTTLEYRRGYYGVKETPLPRPTGPARPNRVQITNNGSKPAPFVQQMQLGAIDPGGVRFEVHISAPDKIDKLPPAAPQSPDNRLDAKHREQPFRTFNALIKVPGGQVTLTPNPAGRYQGKVEFVALLFDDQGTLINEATKTAELNLLPASYQRVQQAGMGITVPLQVPVKGTYFLRIGIHDLTSNKAGTLEVAAQRVKLGTD
jgi:VWFA-related protein